MNYGGYPKRDGRISFSSILLLIIFVSAGALIVAAVLWRPWFDDEAPIVQAEPTATATADGTVAQPPTETPVGGAPQGP